MRCEEDLNLKAAEIIFRSLFLVKKKYFGYGMIRLKNFQINGMNLNGIIVIAC